jgi:DNA polymerase-4
MVEKLAFQLRSEEWLTSTVVIKSYANFDTETKTMQSGLYLSRSYPDKKCHGLFDKLYQRRMRPADGIRFSGLVRGTYQINMFEDTEEMLSLYQAMDRMKDRYGFDAVMRCAGATFKPNNSRNFETQIITQCTSTVILSPALRHHSANSYSRLLPVMLRQWH